MALCAFLSTFLHYGTQCLDVDGGHFQCFSGFHRSKIKVINNVRTSSTSLLIKLWIKIRLFSVKYTNYVISELQLLSQLNIRVNNFSTSCKKTLFYNWVLEVFQNNTFKWFKNSMPKPKNYIWNLSTSWSNPAKNNFPYL